MKTTFNLKTVALTLVAGFALASATAVKAVAFDYASSPGGLIMFDGAGNFTFSAGPNFKVSTGSAEGDSGTIAGTFAIGKITDLGGGVASAPVTGNGTLSITDSASQVLSANITWVNILQAGTGGILNTVGSVDISGITYSGSNADLLALASAGSGVNVLTFQFASTLTLEQLITTPPNSTSFSGSIASVPDGGATVALLGSALTGIAIMRRKLKK